MSSFVFFFTGNDLMLVLFTFQVLSHRDEIVKYLITLGPLLISRFKEREDNVKWDIMHAYTALLSQTRNLIPNFSAICFVSTLSVLNYHYLSVKRGLCSY